MDSLTLDSQSGRSVDSALLHAHDGPRRIRLQPRSEREHPNPHEPRLRARRPPRRRKSDFLRPPISQILFAFQPRLLPSPSIFQSHQPGPAHNATHSLTPKQAFHIRRSGSFWGPGLVCFGLFGLSLLALSACSTRETPFALYVAVVFANGLFTGGALNYTLAHLLHLAPPETHYVATSLLGTFRGFAGSFGSAIGGGVFSRTLRGSLERGLRELDGGGDGGELGPGREELVRRLMGSPLLVYHGGLSPENAVAVQGYSDALSVLFRAAVGLTLVVLVLQACTGWRGPGDKAREREEGLEETRE